MTFTPVTLCFLTRESAGVPQVLLGLKKTGFGRGKVVGLGGHVEPGETDEEAACREVHEEAGIAVRQEDLRDAGVVAFDFPSRPEWNMRTRLFVAARWTGQPAESAEIRPEWFDVGALPVDRMWQDAAHWLPLVLGGSRLRLTIVLNPDNETVREVLDYSSR